MASFRVKEEDLLSREQMENLPTHRLLAYYKKLHRGIQYTECKSNSVQALKKLAEAKKVAKTILDSREHIEK